MSDYPALTEMGIQRFSEIQHYTLRADGKKRDLLKVFYKREKGSLLPKRKTFRFGRSVKTQSIVGQPNSATEIYEVSPFLLKAIAELDLLIDTKHTKVDKASLLLHRIEELEAEIQSATQDLKAIIKSL